MPLKDLLKKRHKTHEDSAQPDLDPAQAPFPQVTIVRTDTHTQEILNPPSFDGDHDIVPAPHNLTPPKKTRSRLRKGSTASVSSQTSEPEVSSPVSRRISQRLHLSKEPRKSSEFVPEDLPVIAASYEKGADTQDKEAQWEDRATRLAHQDGAHPKSPVGTQPPHEAMSQLGLSDRPASRPSSRGRSVSDAAEDMNIQEAIRLHEAGDLARATQMFGRLADSGNVLSQVLYGLSLRHGWGCDKDPTKAVTYLRSAASNSADIEAEALKAGMKKGGAAKGELILAIYELAQCFRNGWGVEVDKPAARQYYETAANLGDTDAMNEAAWCYLEGFGGKKDKVSRIRSLISSFEMHTASVVGTSSVTVPCSCQMETFIRAFERRRRDEISFSIQPHGHIQKFQDTIIHRVGTKPFHLQLRAINCRDLTCSSIGCSGKFPNPAASLWAAMHMSFGPLH